MQASGNASMRLLTIKEAAGRLRLSPATVYALCQRGALPFARVSAHALRINEQDLAEFVRRRSGLPT